ncbi:hypothetical protein BH23PSE1_BH23PSE1_17440 [soil metagenome]
MNPALRAAAKPLALMLQDRLAVIGLAVLSLIVAMALFAPLLSTHDPRLINETEEASVLQRTAAGWELAPSLGPVALSAAATHGATGLAVGRGGTAFRFDAGAWSPLEPATGEDLHAVAFAEDGWALAVGDGGTVLSLEGDTWTPIPAPEPAPLHGVAWIDTNTALIVGAGERIWHLDVAAPSFSEVESPVGRGFDLNAVARDADGTMLAVGGRGLAVRYDPSEGGASLERLGSARDLNGIHIAPNGAALAVGERGTLLRRADGEARWTEDEAPDIRALRAGWIGEDGRAFAAGRNGIVMERQDGEWHLAPTESERHIRALMVIGEDAFALGSDRFVNRLAQPSGEHWFGTDHLGRDLYSQNVHGSRIALLVGFLGASLVVLIGANVGLVAGYFRGRTESVLMRTVDVMYGIPFEPFALILVLLFSPSLTIVILAVSLLTWRTVARLIRSQVLSLRERPFVKAARVAGASDMRIMYLHIFPNVLPLVFLELAIIVGVTIIAEATLSFLGLGPPQSISWGGILHNARLSGAWRTAWWWNVPPGLFIMTTVLSVFFISRSLELIANPRLRARE